MVAQDMPFDAVCLCPVSLIRRGGEVFFARREDRGARLRLQIYLISFVRKIRQQKVTLVI